MSDLNICGEQQEQDHDHWGYEDDGDGCHIHGELPLWTWVCAKYSVWEQVQW